MPETKHDIALELQRLAQDVELGEVAPDRVVLVLQERMGELAPLEPEDDINGISCESLMECFAALCEAGVVHVQIHPLLWPEWRSMFAERDPAVAHSRQMNESLQMRAEVEGASFVALATPFRGKGDLREQWMHLDPNYEPPLRKLNPQLN